MHYKRDPAEVAARYRVSRVGESDFELLAGSTKLELTRGYTFLSFSATPLSLSWHVERDGDPFYVVRLAVTNVAIGFPGDEGWSSELVDDCFFVIDGEALRHAPLSELRVVSATKFNKTRAMLAASRGTKPSVEPQASKPFALALIAALHLDEDLPLECEIGLPDAHFDKLVRDCGRGRIQTAYFDGGGVALTSSMRYGAARDLILCAESEIDTLIDSLSFTYRDVTPPAAKFTDTQQEKSIEAGEPAQPSVVHAPQILQSAQTLQSSIEGLRRTIKWVGGLVVFVLLLLFLK